MTDERKMCRDMLALNEGLTEWEIQFLESIDKQLESGRSLSQKQSDALRQIWETH